MKEVDYIVVGLGIAGISVCRQLDKLNKSYLVYDTGKYNATGVAGGIVNPVIIKRLNPVWKASEFLNEATVFYQELQQALQIDFLQKADIARIFNSAEEQNDWLVASDRANLKEFLEEQPRKTNNPGINAPFGFGHVVGGLKIDTALLISSFRSGLKQRNRILANKFDHTNLQVNGKEVIYNDSKAKHIIYCEGAATELNKLLKSDVIIPKKGEYLTIEADGLNIDTILKGTYFVIPRGNHRYETGATFVHGDNELVTTEASKDKLVDALKKILNVHFKVISQTVGMRPTVKDRRPILGALSDESPIHYLNGLGTRGLLMAPLLSKWLLDHIEDGKKLAEEVDIRRFLP